MKAILKVISSNKEQQEKLDGKYFNASVTETNILILADGEALSFDKDVIKIEFLLKDCWLGNVYEKLYRKVEQIEIDRTELSSYHYDPNPYDVEPQLIGSSKGYDWDTDEEWEKQVEVFFKQMEENPTWFMEDFANWIPEGKEESEDDSQYVTDINNIVKDYLK